MGPEDDHVANKKGVGSKENLESIRSDPNMGNWRIGQNTNGNRWKNAENVGNNGKHQKTSETSELNLVQKLQGKAAENVGNVGIGFGATLQRKGVENIGKQQKTWETSELELVEIWQYG